ncbi:MAG: helix-turn-helix domain-containing protein [Acidaminococcales bacterium]|jgi:AraC family transcriptional regulator of adaptative response / DNA-3-methyladenine glycosylase II|nr:helix-turn-helix domain-containing protein [Acidaminococcales bacterium]
MRQKETLDPDSCYAAVKARDSRFDGRFFVGVRSTGIYCRPICSARVPKKENCVFFVSAAAAERAGYRPCLKCRPELAPADALAPVDAAGRLARRAALLMEENGLADTSLAGLADGLGVTDRHLRRVFFAQFGVSPLQYLQNRRLLLAKSLLTDTALPVTEVAFAAGFGSVRRFNDIFRRFCRLSPSALRKNGGEQDGAQGGITLLLGYRPPYDWDGILDFLAGRAIAGVEKAEGGKYCRSVGMASGGKNYCGWLAVENLPKKNCLSVTLASSLLPLLSKILSRVRNMFDLDCRPAQVYEQLSVLNDLRPGLCKPGCRLPGCIDPFEAAARAVIGQQITVKAARTLAGRLVRVYGAKIAAPVAGLTNVFPSPEAIFPVLGPEGEELTAIGLTRAKARAVRALAESILTGRLNLSASASPEEAVSLIREMPGFGDWTAEYIAMRALGWTDAFLPTDLGVRKAFPGLSARQLRRLAEAWRPWRAYAMLNIWQYQQ